MSLPDNLKMRIAGLEAEASRLGDLAIGSTVPMTMLGGGLRIEIPASVAAESMRIALAGLANLPPEDAMVCLGVVPVLNMVPIPGDEFGGCTLEPSLELAPLPPGFR